MSAADHMSADGISTTPCRAPHQVDSEPASQGTTTDEQGVIATTVERARQAADWWQARSVRQRAKVLLAFRDRLLDRLDDVVDVVGRELNKPRFDVVNEVMQSCDLIGYYAKRAPRFLKARSIRPHLLVHKRVQVHYRPMGVVGIITPWNYPVVLVLGPTVQALIAGNAVVLKPSERATETALLLHRIFEDADLPAPVFQVVPGGPETALALADSDVDKIAFTGGRAGGQAVLQAAAKRLTPVLLELGGNDAMIVTADADLRRASHAAVWGAFLNAGQSCIAVERCYVEQSVAEPFIARVVELTRNLSQGLSIHNAPHDMPAGDADHDVGPLCSEAQFDHVAALVDEALAAGAEVRVGGPPGDRTTRCYPPTVMTGVNHRMRLMRGEVFGPVLAIQPVADREEAVRLANDSRFGLSASLWTRDRRWADRAAGRLRVGSVAINDCLVHFAIVEAPFGGVGESGFGRTHGVEGLREFCSTQTVARHWFGPRLELQWFPYRSKHRLMRKVARLLFRSGLMNKLRGLRR